MSCHRGNENHDKGQTLITCPKGNAIWALHQCAATPFPVIACHCISMRCAALIGGSVRPRLQVLAVVLLHVPGTYIELAAYLISPKSLAARVICEGFA
jgi:hypothetical protein